MALYNVARAGLRDVYRINSKQNLFTKRNFLNLNVVRSLEVGVTPLIGNRIDRFSSVLDIPFNQKKSRLKNVFISKRTFARFGMGGADGIDISWNNLIMVPWETIYIGFNDQGVGAQIGASPLPGAFLGVNNYTQLLLHDAMMADTYSDHSIDDLLESQNQINFISIFNQIDFTSLFAIISDITAYITMLQTASGIAGATFQMFEFVYDMHFNFELLND